MPPASTTNVTLSKGFQLPVGAPNPNVNAGLNLGVNTTSTIPVSAMPQIPASTTTSHTIPPVVAPPETEIINKRKLSEMVSQISPNTKLDPEVEEVKTFA
jgi:transcription initiation factor TFIID subunit TAF12